MFSGILNAVLSAIGALLSALKGGGVNIGSIGDLALNAIETTQVDETNYLNGQAVPIGTLSYQGQAGTIVAVKNGGPAAQSLGL